MFDWVSINCCHSHRRNELMMLLVDEPIEVRLVK